MNNVYIKIKQEDEFKAFAALCECGIENDVVRDPLDIVCDELVCKFIEDSKPDLQPLFRSIQPQILDDLIESKDSIINHGNVKDTINYSISNIGEILTGRIVD